MNANGHILCLHSKIRGHLDLPLSARPSVRKNINFVTKVEKWGHPCHMDKFLVSFYIHSTFVREDTRYKKNVLLVATMFPHCYEGIMIVVFNQINILIISDLLPLKLVTDWKHAVLEEKEK